MNNKLALRFSIFVLVLFLISGIFYLYLAVRCGYGDFLCVLLSEAIIRSFLEASAVTLFFISLGLFILAKFYKGGRLLIRYGIPYVLLVLALIAFVPFIYVFVEFIQEPSFKERLAQQEQWNMEFQQKKVQKCEEKNLMIAQVKERDPMSEPTGPWPEECGKY